MADEKDSGEKAAKPAAEKKASKPKKAKAKSKNAAAKKSGAKKASKAKAKKAAPKKAAADKGGATKASSKPAGKGSSRPTVGLDKSIAQFRDSLEHSVTLSRERIQEVVDDAVKRGRMTHGDAEKMIGELLKRGRKQTDAMLSELEKLARAARRRLP